MTKQLAARLCEILCEQSTFCCMTEDGAGNYQVHYIIEDDDTRMSIQHITNKTPITDLPFGL